MRQRIAALEDSLAMTGFSVNHKLKSEVGAGLTLGIFEIHPVEAYLLVKKRIISRPAYAGLEPLSKAGGRVR